MLPPDFLFNLNGFNNCDKLYAVWLSGRPYRHNDGFCTWLKYRYYWLPLHQLCSDTTNITSSALQQQKQKQYK